MELIHIPALRISSGPMLLKSLHLTSKLGQNALNLSLASLKGQVRDSDDVFHELSLRKMSPRTLEEAGRKKKLRLGKASQSDIKQC